MKRYKNEKAYKKDANKMLKRGYEVADMQVEDTGRGCLKWGCLGIFAFLFPSRKEYVVTYRQKTS